MTSCRENWRAPTRKRFSYITYALEHGWSIDEIYRLSRIDRWFLDQLKQVMEIQEQVEGPEARRDSIRISCGLSKKRRCRIVVWHT